MDLGIVLSAKDNVATVIRPIAAGEKVTYHFGDIPGGVVAKEDIPIYHKIALRAITKGSDVVKYGCRIGAAQCDIQPGDLVHTQNLASFPGEEGSK
ncbi:MAG TPA: UxaA family hydrolase [Firmicutes bacterium]|nr:UxaA family hydrolase [Bacillota bacterium]